MHASNNMAAIGSNEDSLIKSNRTAYQYIHAKVDQGDVTVMISDRLMQRIEKDTAKYLYEENEYICIHGVDEDIKVPEMLNDVHDTLFLEFLTIQHSYCVNQV